MNTNDVDFDFEEGEDQVANTEETDEQLAKEEQETGISEDQDNADYSENEEEDKPNEDSDFLTSILKARGIDPKAIKVENEDGEIEEVSFDSLSREEQLDIFNSTEDEDTDLEDEEIDLINQIRDSGVSPKEYLEWYKKQILEESSQVDPTYSVDDMADDELFIADLKARISEITDDEALQALELEKSHEDLFNKKIASLRTEYKSLEDQQKQKEVEEEQQAQKEEYQVFEGKIVSAIEDAKEGIDLGELTLAWSEDDMNEVASYILDSDSTGVRYIARALQDPKKLVEMTWYALKGQEAISLISDYYKKQITKASKTNYEKGYEDAKNGNHKNLTKSVVRQPLARSKSSRETSIDDLD